MSRGEIFPSRALGVVKNSGSSGWWIPVRFPLISVEHGRGWSSCWRAGTALWHRFVSITSPGVRGEWGSVLILHSTLCTLRSQRPIGTASFLTQIANRVVRQFDAAKLFKVFGGHGKSSKDNGWQDIEYIILPLVCQNSTSRTISTSISTGYYWTISSYFF